MSPRKSRTKPVQDAAAQAPGDAAVPTAAAESADFNPAEFEQPNIGPAGDQVLADAGVTPPPGDSPQHHPMPPLGRGWTQRYSQPVKYARSTFKDAYGKEHIAFRFDLVAGETKPPEEVINVMRDHKFWKDGNPNGLAEDARQDQESYPTGLRFDNLPRGGRAWMIQNDVMGRTVADSLDQALDGVAKKLEGGVGGPG